MGIIFDLDGTLLNTLEGHAGSFNRALASLGLPGHEIDAYRYFIGDGATRCAERAMPVAERSDPELVRTCVARFSADYKDTWRTTTLPYPGIEAMLDELQQSGFRLAVLSNKDHAFTDEMVRSSFDGIRFGCVAGFGYRGIVEHKPAPSGPRLIAQALEMCVRELTMVGDTSTDIATAIGSGMLPVGVLWGFRDRTELENAGAVHIVADPQEVPALMIERRAASNPSG